MPSSCDLQATGTYISRSLSYTGAEFAIIRVEVDPVFKVRLPPGSGPPHITFTGRAKAVCTQDWLSSKSCTARLHALALA